VFFSLVFGNKQGILFAIIGGIFQDVLISSVIGVNVFIYAFIAVVIDFIDDSLFKDNTITPIILLICSTFIYNLMFIIFMFFLSEELNYGEFFKIVSIEIILNTIVGIIIYKFGIKKIVGYNLR
jgi:rod shape-determining protein MreD